MSALDRSTSGLLFAHIFAAVSTLVTTLLVSIRTVLGRGFLDGKVHDIKIFGDNDNRGALPWFTSEPPKAN